MEFVRRRIKQLGFDSFSYSATRTTAHHKSMFVLTSYESQTWLTRYFRERYFELDPRVALASPTGMPFLWNTADMRADLPRAQMRSERLGGAEFVVVLPPSPRPGAGVGAPDGEVRESAAHARRQSA